MVENNTIPFNGTPEQHEKLMAAIEKYKGTKGALIPVLHEAQEIYGYLPIEVQKTIAEGINVPLSEIYGVVTFYTQFVTQPKGEYRFAVCLGTACYVKGANLVLEKLEEELGISVGDCTDDLRFSLEGCRCIGACGLAPVITINEDVYGRLSPNDVPDILAKYKE